MQNKTTKHKELGVFYSPNYIARYILQETVGIWFEEQNDFFEALQSVAILDPSCGEGIFLVESFEFLLRQYQTYFPSFPNPEIYIVANNLFGVDIDEKAVEVTKKLLLSKVENKNINLNHVKQGNSLIDSSEFSPRAFNWQIRKIIWKISFRVFLQGKVIFTPL
jgi:type I restriction-modification system DNA methylase subunit